MVELIFSFLFWFSTGVVAYTYFGYPAFLYVLSIFLKQPVRKAPAEPSVSVIISAFNEERAIERKLVNLLALDYPEEKLEILVGSDGASDRTDEIVSKFHSARIRFFRFVENFGKPHVLSALVQEAGGEILVFTDARQEFDRDTVRALVANFEDSKVGCISGELYLRMPSQGSGAVAGGMNAYWRYEKFLRKKESAIGSMLGATGAVYAIRKILFPKALPADILVDDMYIPFEVIAKGYRAVFESEARAYDQVSKESAQEFKRKVRTLTGNYQVFKHFPKLFIPFKSPIAWQLFSHKFLRLFVPFFLVLVLISNLFLLKQSFYLYCLVLQIIFYGLATYEAWRMKNHERKKGIGYLPYMFCLLNYSAVMGFLCFIRGEQQVTWERAYA
ncbi:MAG: glycosyltransferase family 2 protein [Candidatus Omnitrophica bacterium]|nr:glycosyltransferase family 2 protein [Candidatus Omnitrophota bacterium]